MAVTVETEDCVIVALDWERLLKLYGAEVMRAMPDGDLELLAPHNGGYKWQSITELRPKVEPNTTVIPYVMPEGKRVMA